MVQTDRETTRQLQQLERITNQAYETEEVLVLGVLSHATQTTVPQMTKAVEFRETARITEFKAKAAVFGGSSHPEYSPEVIEHDAARLARLSTGDQSALREVVTETIASYQRVLDASWDATLNRTRSGITPEFYHEIEQLTKAYTQFLGHIR